MLWTSIDRKSTRLNSSNLVISYAVFCLKKKQDLKAGVDLDITYDTAYLGPLIENVEEVRVPVALGDRAVRRVLELKFLLFFFFNDTATTEIYTLSLHDALPICMLSPCPGARGAIREIRSPRRTGPSAPEVGAPWAAPVAAGREDQAERAQAV